MPPIDDRRSLLQRQLGIMWRFAQEFVIDHVDEELALWEPSGHVCTVHPTAAGWVADWPDEETRPIANPTIGWLLWHIEWWWGDTIARVRGREPLAATGHRWSGGTGGIVAAKREWDDVLAGADLDAPVQWLAPEPQPLWFVASWVNVELTKNLAEINLIKTLQANASAPDAPRS